MNTNPWYIITAAIVSGTFAFLGAIAGQFFNRFTQRETWLLQKRAEVFSKFLLDLHEYDKECIRIDDTVADEMENSKLNSAALGRLFISENIVCFYLSDVCKKEFRVNVDKLIKFEPDFSGIDTKDVKSLRKCYEPIYQIEDNIQKNFEKNLSDISWYK